MNPLARASMCAVLILLSACGTFEVSIDGTPTPDISTTGTVGGLQTQNADLATRVATIPTPPAIATPIPSVVPGSSAEPSAQAAPPATRITFLNGASVGVVSAPIAAGQTQSYVLDAFQSQPMFVYVASIGNDVTVSIKTDTGTTILSPNALQNSWQGSLPRTGDYYLSIHGGASTENFSLTVTVPWRLQFAKGADSATVSGQTVAGYDVSYTVFASKGQKMSVNLEQLSSKASLSIYGFTDGQRYLRSDSGQKSYGFVLPSTQDYIVVVVPMDGSVVNYILTVRVQ